MRAPYSIVLMSIRILSCYHVWIFRLFPVYFVVLNNVEMNTSVRKICLYFWITLFGSHWCHFMICKALITVLALNMYFHTCCETSQLLLCFTIKIIIKEKTLAVYIKVTHVYPLWPSNSAPLKIPTINNAYVLCVSYLGGYWLQRS